MQKKAPFSQGPLYNIRRAPGVINKSMIYIACTSRVGIHAVTSYHFNLEKRAPFYNFINNRARWYHRPFWRKRAAPAYRPGHKISIITALRLLYHSSKPIRACLPQSGWQTGKAVCTTHIIPQKIPIAIVWRSESTKNLHNLYKRPYSV